LTRDQLRLRAGGDCRLAHGSRSTSSAAWLIDRERLAGRFPPRVRVQDLWRVADPWLQQAQDDATLLAIRAQEEAGLDVITDGEIRRESYSNRFATALEGIDIDNPGMALDRSGHPNPVPRIVGRVRRPAHRND
jgi:5-methyltetrahydropteroyltriglutamate--homocysteine methyltransferase